MTTHEITNSEDIIDSRDIIERIEELESTIEDLELDADKEEFQEELNNLKKIQDEREDYGDWKYGLTFLRDSYMDEDWAENEVKDLGYLDDKLPYFIEHNIDWEGVLQDLRQNYSEIDFDGITYWVRE